MGIAHHAVEHLDMYCLGEGISVGLLPRLVSVPGGVAAVGYRPAGGFAALHSGTVVAFAHGKPTPLPLLASEPARDPEIHVSSHGSLMCVTVDDEHVGSRRVTVEDLAVPDTAAAVQQPEPAWFGMTEEPWSVAFHGRWLVARGEFSTGVSDRGRPALTTTPRVPLAGSDDVLVTKEAPAAVTMWRADPTGRLVASLRHRPVDLAEGGWEVVEAHADGSRVVLLWAGADGDHVVEVVDVDGDGAWWTARTELVGHLTVAFGGGTAPTAITDGRDVHEIVVEGRTVSVRPVASARDVGLRLIFGVAVHGDELVALGQAAYDDSHDVAAISFNSLSGLPAKPSRPAAPAGRQPGHVIRTFADAEEAAAVHLRWLGFADAATTAAGADLGVDVVAGDVVAQVKAQTSPVGRPVVQQTFGEATRRGGRAAVYALAGFTDDAVGYANDVGVALFTFDLQGAAKPTNAAAGRLRP